MKNKYQWIIYGLLGMLFIFIIPLPVPVKLFHVWNNTSWIETTLNTGFFWRSGLYLLSIPDYKSFMLFEVLGFLAGILYYFALQLIKSFRRLR